MGARRQNLEVWSALTAIYVIWGSTYLGIREAERTIPPLLMLSARFIAAGALLYAVVGRGERPTLRQWRSAFVIGGCLLLVGNGGVAWAEQRVPTGTAALLIATVPLWLALLDRVVYGQRLSRAAFLGLVVGFGGVALLVGGSGGGHVDLAGAFVLVFGASVWAIGSLYSRHAPLPERPLVGAAMEMLAAGVLLALAGLARGEAGDLQISAISGGSLGALAYLITIGSLVGFTAYVWLLRNAPTSLVGTYAFVNPVVAVLLGAVFLSESIGARMLLAGGAIVVAVALIVTARPVPTAEVPVRERGASPRRAFHPGRAR